MPDQHPPATEPEAERSPHRSKIPAKPLTGVSRKLQVSVDVATIDQAQERSSSHCMIADAIRKTNPGVQSVQVDLQTIRFTDPKKEARYIWLTPPLAQRALINFDQGIPCEPFDFQTTKPVQVIRAKGRGGKGKRNRKAGEPAAPRPKAPSRAREGVAGLNAEAKGRPVLLGGFAIPNAVLSSSPRRGLVRRFGLAQLKP
jgi:hypothetical protein